MTTITINTNDQQVLDAVKALLKGFEVSFKVIEGRPYDPEFVDKIEKSRQQAKEGKTVKINLDEIWK